MAAAAAASDNESPWELYYWPGVQGRGEYIRLVFVEAGVEWVEKNAEKGMDTIVDFIYKGGNTGFPVFACPVVKHGDFVLSQTTAIVKYLATKFGLDCDETAEDAAHGLSIALGVADFLMEAQNAFHPVDTHGRYAEQKAEADVSAAKFAKTRMVKWLQTFESELKWNNGGNGFFVGDKCTYVDLSVFQAVDAARNQFPDAFAGVDVPLLKAFQERIRQRPKLAAYFASGKQVGFGTDSMM